MRKTGLRGCPLNAGDWAARPPIECTCFIVWFWGSNAYYDSPGEVTFCYAFSFASRRAPLRHWHASTIQSSSPIVYPGSYHIFLAICDVFHHGMAIYEQVLDLFDFCFRNSLWS